MARDFVTAADVAKLAGVSRSAVSRAFTPGASVSSDTRRRVEEAAARLGYRVNRLAQSLISARSNLIGVVGANLSTPFIARQLDELSLALLRRGMNCLVLNAADADHGITPLIERILEFRARAVIVLSGTPPAALVEECIANGVRLILMHREAEDASTDTVVSDDTAGARLAAERLLAAGCRRPALVGSSTPSPTQSRRRDGFLGGMRRAGLEPIVWATAPGTEYETGVHSARELLAAHEIDAAFCTTDLIALGFLDTARAAFGRRVPEDLSVIGFDDIPQSGWRAYDLTTLRQNVAALCEAVLTALDNDATAPGAVRLSAVLPVELVERGTVRPAAPRRTQDGGRLGSVRAPMVARSR